MAEPMQTEDAGNQENTRKINHQGVPSSCGQPHNQSSIGEPTQTDESGYHSNQSKTHHQNFPGSSAQRDNLESSAPQPGQHGSSSRSHPLHDLENTFVQYSNHREQQENQRAQRDSKQLSKKGRLWSLKGQLPNNVHGMSSAVHQHCWFLHKVPDKD
ncbi:hypothetical protein O181_085266 [Austropuccinia psidii MF-1]|uniref:Uncharacterized protein n=1 Tax=Austropuccinia psidii MF-1 TaxID=1389203 RepID=A0A9Q3FSK2_9BASI|nr:hypothetical protein [Austropuccinia psidii MF-1]